MISWRPLFNHTRHLPAREPSRIETFSIDMAEDISTLRVRCDREPREVSIDPAWADYLYSLYTRHPEITPDQRDLSRDAFNRALRLKINRFPIFNLYDAQNQFRGRWDPSFSGWRILGSAGASDGFVPGPIPPGPLRMELLMPGHLPETVTLHFQMEGSRDTEESNIVENLFTLQKEESSEEQIRWYIGELHEHTTRSNGHFTPEETMAAYHSAGYEFLALADHGVPPLDALPLTPPFPLIRSQEVETACGHALLLGVREYTRIYPEEGPDSLPGLIYHTHLQGGLFAVVHPFSLDVSTPGPSWSAREMDWKGVDLLEVWPGRWAERFPEILESLDLWDHLLNSGHRIFGTSGKGSGIPLDSSTVEQIPKILVLSEGPSETQLLAALKQGHFYATVEPAISLRVESEFGDALTGEEIKIPVQHPYTLLVEVSQMERGFLKIKTNQGVYCQMPVSSTRGTQLKLYERARPGVQWYRLELYRYGRPLDELLALGNPVFVRGFHRV
ncbi:MAG TPA: CehA/McbA family metallohydrolase [bacterium]|nr:CehA/McbA family metallohydrolase [bacterium]